MTDDALLAYYRQRAREYERIYEKPERQPALRALREWVCDQLSGHDILEVACGTGYWTQSLAGVARSILAIDAADEVLQIARQKQFPEGRVSFERGDAYQLLRVPGRFTAAFAGFWWSHVPRQGQDEFFSALHARLGRGTIVVLIDNRFVEGSSTPICRTDALGNTYQVRTLADGSRHEVVKNFPVGDELPEFLSRRGSEVRWREFEYYWGVRYIVDE